MTAVRLKYRCGAAATTVACVCLLHTNIISVPHGAGVDVSMKIHIMCRCSQNSFSKYFRTKTLTPRVEDWHRRDFDGPPCQGEGGEKYEKENGERKNGNTAGFDTPCLEMWIRGSRIGEHSRVVVKRGISSMQTPRYTASCGARICCRPTRMINTACPSCTTTTSQDPAMTQMQSIQALPPAIRRYSNIN